MRKSILGFLTIFVINVTVFIILSVFRYCKPEYDFPTQNVIIEEVISVVKDELSRNPKALIVCGAYLIGKDRPYHLKLSCLRKHKQSTRIEKTWNNLGFFCNKF